MNIWVAISILAHSYIHIITLVSHNLQKLTLINCVYYSISSQAIHIYVLLGQPMLTFSFIRRKLKQI